MTPDMADDPNVRRLLLALETILSALEKHGVMIDAEELPGTEFARLPEEEIDVPDTVPESWMLEDD
jgi:hypothetical protein